LFRQQQYWTNNLHNWRVDQESRRHSGMAFLGTRKCSNW